MYRLRIIAMVLLTLLLSGCDNQKNLYEINEFRWQGRMYYVPRIYEKMAWADTDRDQSIYLQVMYPHFSPLSQSPQKYWDEGTKYHYIIRILVSDKDPKIPFETAIRTGMKSYEATELVGEEYGLWHYTQPEGKNQDSYDYWIEKNSDELISYITCSEILSERSVPQCRYFIPNEKVYYIVSFDKRLLPHWSSIKKNTEEIYTSFASPEAALEFLNSRLEISNE